MKVVPLATIFYIIIYIFLYNIYSIETSTNLALVAAVVAQKATMTNLWNTAGLPHKGWCLEGSEDLKQPTGTCGMCNKSHIRYIHHIKHPEGLNLSVGSVCAEKLTQDYDFLEQLRTADKKLKKQAQERKQTIDWMKKDFQHWLTQSWTANKKNTVFFRAEYTQSDQGWRYKGKVIFANHKFTIKSMFEDDIKQQVQEIAQTHAQTFITKLL
jgi:hypothetical protein